MRFNIIYADPPWPYRDKANAGNRGAGHKYALLTLDAIKALPVAEVAERDCVLALWVPNPLLPDGLAVMAAWGFAYKTVLFHWRKITLSDAPAWGMGHWTRSNLELCLLGVRGRPKRVSAAVHAEVAARRMGEHSAKPSQVRDRLVDLLGPVSRLELFAREIAPGWLALGNEIDGEDIRESLPLLAALEEDNDG